METPTPEQIKIAAKYLALAYHELAKNGEDQTAMHVVIEWLRSGTAIDRRPELLELMRQIHPASPCVSIHSSLSRYGGHIREGSWSAHAQIPGEKEQAFITAGSADALLGKIKSEIDLRNSAPITVDGIPIDQLSAVMQSQV